MLEESVMTYVAEESNEIIGYGMLLSEEVGWSARNHLPGRPAGAPPSKHRERADEDDGGGGEELDPRKLALEVGVANVPALNLYLHSGFVIEGTVPDYYGKGPTRSTWRSA